MEPEVLPPDYFVSVGVASFKPEHVEPILKRFALFGLDPNTTPWVVLELVMLCENEFQVEVEYINAREGVPQNVSLSKVFIPAPPDPDIPTTTEFPHSFRIGPALDTSLIVGVAPDAFKRGYEDKKLCYFEVHLWVKSRDGQHAKSAFIWTILREGATVCIAAIDSRPMIVPIDVARKYKCQYAKMNNIGPKFD